MYSVHGKLVVTNNLDNYTKDNNIKIFPNCTVFFFWQHKQLVVQVDFSCS